MKRILAFAMAFLCAGIFSASAQFTESNPLEINSAKIKAPQMQSTGADTLSQYLDRTSDFTSLRFAFEGKELCLTGTNGFFNYVGARYRFRDEAVVRGCIVMIPDKKQMGEPDVFDLLLYEMDFATGLAKGTPIASGSINSTEIDTASRRSYIAFDEPAAVDNDFVVYFRIDSGEEAADTIWVATNNVGDACGERTATVMQASAPDNYICYYLDNIPCMQMTVEPDIDILIMPVVEYPTGIEAETGALAAWPNPASDILNIPLVGAAPREEMLIVNSAGKVAKSHSITPEEAGNALAQIDISTLPAGSYYYINKSGNHYSAKSFLIMR
ncbi:MAG: T9SS type A sorting domain-containing protein [Candidatus Kapaibacterium sp.]